MIEIFRGVLAVHVAGGLAALVLFWTALAQRKGSARHRRLGRAYLATMAFTMATALVLAGMTWSEPLSIHPAPPGLDAVAVATHADDVKAFAFFLNEIAVGTLLMLWIGWRAVRGARARGEGWRSPDAAVPLITVAIGLAALALVGDGHAVVAIGLLSIAPLLGRSSRDRRLAEHLVGMLGSATAAHTAVVVSVVPRLLGQLYETDPALNAAPWVVPPLIGIAGIVYALRRPGSALLAVGGPDAPPRPERA